MKKSKMSLLFVVIFLFSLFSSNAFAISDDKIMSQDIKEADGTSGQDTNTGSGIKTGHIQDGAVTPAKIGFYSNVIIVAPSGGDFTSPVDAMNAITDASASNPYLVKIMPGEYNIQSNMLQMKPYVDIEGSGESVTRILGYNYAVIRGASTAEIRFLTVISSCVNPEPGYSVFGVFNENVTRMKLTHVNVEVLKTCGIGGAAIYNLAGYSAASTVEINDSIVAITASNGDSVGIGNTASSITVNNVAISANGPGWVKGINSVSIGEILATSVSNNIKINVTTAGVGAAGVSASGRSSTIIRDLAVTSNAFGIDNQNATVKVEHSTIIAPIYTIRTIETGYRTYVAATRLDGGPVLTGSGATTVCAGTYDENFTFYPNVCP